MLDPRILNGRKTPKSGSAAADMVDMRDQSQTSFAKHQVREMAKNLLLCIFNSFVLLSAFQIASASRAKNRCLMMKKDTVSADRAKGFSSATKAPASKLNGFASPSSPMPQVSPSSSPDGLELKIQQMIQSKAGLREYMNLNVSSIHTSIFLLSISHYLLYLG